MALETTGSLLTLHLNNSVIVTASLITPTLAFIYSTTRSLILNTTTIVNLSVHLASRGLIPSSDLYLFLSMFVPCTTQTVKANFVLLVLLISTPFSSAALSSLAEAARGGDLSHWSSVHTRLDRLDLSALESWNYSLCDEYKREVVLTPTQEHHLGKCKLGQASEAAAAGVDAQQATANLNTAQLASLVMSQASVITRLAEKNVDFSLTANGGHDTDTDRIGLCVVGGQSEAKSALIAQLINVPVYSGSGTATLSPIQYITTEACAPQQVRTNGPVIFITGYDHPLAGVYMPLENATSVISDIQQRLKREGLVGPTPLTVEVFVCHSFVPFHALDLPGLVGVGSDIVPGAQQAIQQLSTQAFQRYIKDKSGATQLLIVQEMSIEVDKSSWRSVFGTDEDEMRANTKKCRSCIVVLTKANLWFNKLHMLDEGDFKGVTTWEALEELLFLRIKQIFANPDLPIFIVGGTSFGSSDLIERMKMGSTYDQIWQQVQADNRRSTDAIIATLHQLEERRGFVKNEVARDAFIAKYVGVDKLRSYISHNILQQFTDRRLNQLTQAAGKLDEQLRAAVKHNLEELERIKHGRLAGLSDSLYGLLGCFHLVFTALMRGPSIENPVAAFGESTLKNDASSCPVALTNEIRMLLKKNTFTPLQDLELAEIGVPGGCTGVNEDGACVLRFPFHWSLDWEDMAETEQKALGQQGDAVESFFRILMQSGRRSNGLVCIHAVGRDILARLPHLRPLQLGPDDLEHITQQLNVAVPTLDAWVRLELHQYYAGLLHAQVSPYVARRVAAIVWHCADLSLRFVSSLPTFSGLLSSSSTSSSSSDSPLLLDLKTVIDHHFFHHHFDQMRSTLQGLANRTDKMPSPQQSVLHDIGLLVSGYNKQYVRSWVASYPKTQFSRVHELMLSTLNSGYSQLQVGSVSSFEEVLAGLLQHPQVNTGISQMENDTAAQDAQDRLKQLPTSEEMVALVLKGHRFSSQELLAMMDTQAVSLMLVREILPPFNPILTSLAIYHQQDIAKHPDAVDQPDRLFSDLVDSLSSVNEPLARICRTRNWQFALDVDKEIKEMSNTMVDYSSRSRTLVTLLLQHVLSRRASLRLDGDSVAADIEAQVSLLIDSDGDLFTSSAVQALLDAEYKIQDPSQPSRDRVERYQEMQLLVQQWKKLIRLIQLTMDNPVLKTKIAHYLTQL